MSQGLNNRYPVYSQLQSHQRQLASTHLLSLFEQNPGRAQHLTLQGAGLTIDFSKNFITAETFNLFQQLLDQANFADWREKLVSGELINHTEQRKVLHTTLRSPRQNTDEEKAVQAALTQIESFVERVHSQHWRGFSDKGITDVVNIGIGGSDLGPRMVYQALAPFHSGQIHCHFVANIDGADIQARLDKLNPETTLFIIASKSFSTLETLENGKTARTWMLQGGCSNQDIGKHFVAITSNIEKAVEFGIEQENCFPMWDWVGGRYSLWSAIGLPIALGVGMQHFRSLLAGAHAMDEHFLQTPVEKNLPVLQALLVFWYSHFWTTHSQAVLPYNHLLGFFPAYLQQLDMESLGKQCDREGNLINYPTGIVVWGTEGTNGQHSFHQLLHQGQQFIPADFIICKQAHHSHPHQQQHLIANCLAQSQALMCGKNLEQATEELLANGLPESEAKVLAPHKMIPGNRPSTTIVLNELNPNTLGALIALYEHKVFTLSVLYNLNAFDQWGVELGKKLSGTIYKTLATNEVDIPCDPSTKQLLNYFKSD